ncbi:S41 family peptidase [Pedobacter metabolipauper]|uniref:C-terminal processing protease CtpA/Prc n=1 Tax=Pedobacter metabolipauper TaxID=425513 RepID=A0A4R6SUS4_9SPHI|nr:S41 family peptidase [Pedobacter metabolipauper]TDQ07487.1 C-terminal processing protease CtpA/Prc [Pedobacter metabolipauper]
MENTLNIFKRSALHWLCLFFFFIAVQSSCKKNKDQKPEYPAGSNENVNTWILDSLKRYYYWNESLPSNLDISAKPQDFFNSVRNAADRFSYIINPNDPSTYTPNNKNFGFDYSTIKEQTTGQVIGIIKLVLKDSPASRAGLKRGDYINKINGKQLTEANAQTLQNEILSSDHFTLMIAELNNNTWVDKKSVEISKGVILDQREISKVIESDGKKIGYLYLTDFSPGLANSLTAAFSGFKTSGISDLILDLRYNSGGQVAEAAGLCALIAQGVNYDKPFITYKGNKNGGVKTESLGSAATFDGTVNFNTLLQKNLGLSKVYILGTAATASASEVIINNLKPYMQVILIGETTRGKDEASFSISDARNPKQVQWEMHPIVYKLFNSSGIGGYSAGILPDVPVNELSSLPLRQFGEIEDPLLKAAISQVTGKAIAAVNNKLKQAKTKELAVAKVLLDTRIQAANSSIVITHH